MESKSKEVTGNTPPSFSEEKTGAKVQPSRPSASKENMPLNTTSGQTQSENTKNAGKESLLLAADNLPVNLNIVEANGKARRFKIRGAGDKVTQIVVIFEMTDWTEDLERKFE
jgi:hypothetical protein